MENIKSILKKKFLFKEKQMLVKLEEIRETNKHSGIKGDLVEISFRSFLRSYLPRRFDVGTGEVIDLNGVRSKQTDVVITNQDHPFIFSENEPGFFFIEGVSGAGELKTILTSTKLKDDIKKSYQFKKLRITHTKGSIVDANESDLKRFYNCPPFFLFALESEISLNKILDIILEFEKNNNVVKNSILDGVFILNLGIILNIGDGKGSIQLKDSEDSNGWVILRSETVLLHFLGWLTATMPIFLRFQSVIPKYIF